jgi:hypothetical protein
MTCMRFKRTDPVHTRSGRVYPQNMKMAFKKLRDKLKVYENPYMNVALLYLDVLG